MCWRIDECAWRGELDLDSGDHSIAGASMRAFWHLDGKVSSARLFRHRRNSRLSQTNISAAEQCPSDRRWYIQLRTTYSVRLDISTVGRNTAPQRQTYAIGFAGTPRTTRYAPTSFVTTEPAPTIAYSLMVVPQTIVAFAPIEAPRLTSVRSKAPARFANARGDKHIREHCVRPDEDVLFERDALEQLRAVLDAAAVADLDTRPDVDALADHAVGADDSARRDVRVAPRSWCPRQSHTGDRSPRNRKHRRTCAVAVQVLHFRTAARGWYPGHLQTCVPLGPAL